MIRFLHFCAVASAADWLGHGSLVVLALAFGAAWLRTRR
jgi:hypothetical protein